MKKIFGLFIALMFLSSMAYAQSGGGGMVIHGGTADLYDNLIVHGNVSATGTGSLNLDSPGTIGGTTPGVGYFTTLYVASLQSTAPNGSHYISASNTITPNYTSPTTGDIAYDTVTARWRDYNGTDWTSNVFAYLSDVGSGLSGGTQYELPIWTSASAQSALSNGIAGQMMVSNGASANPSFQDMGSPFFRGLQRGANLAPAFAAAYTVVHNGCTITEAAGTMTVTGASSGANTFTPTTPIVPVAGYVYEVDIPVTTFSAGQYTLSMGGVSEPVVLFGTGVGKQVFYILASSTANLVITMNTTGTQTITFTNISVKTCSLPSPNPKMIIDTNSGDAVTRTVYLPPATAGLQFSEYVIAAYGVVLKSGNGTDSMYLGTTAYTTSLTLGAVRQTFVSLGCYVATAWDLLGLNGLVTGA